MMSSLLSPQALTGTVMLLVDAALKGAVLVAIAAVASKLIAKRSAAARHAVWTAAIAGQLLIPVLGGLLPSWRVALLPAPWTASETSAPLASESKPAGSQTVAPEKSVVAPDNVSSITKENAKPSVPSTVSAITSPRFSRPAWLSDSRAVMAAIWLLGVVIVLLRLAIGTVRVGVLARDGERVADGRWLSLTQRVANALGVERPLILLRGERLAVPVTWGVVYPAVLLPPEADEWPEERRRFVLVHELAHVKRFDALTQLVAQITLALFWFNPLVWVAAHQMRVEREHACDDYVLRDGTPASLYAGELLEMVRSIGTPSHESAAPAFAALAMARRSEFEGRMLAILDPRLDRQTINRKATIMTGAFIALLALPLAALRPFEAEGSTEKTALPAHAAAGSTRSVNGGSPSGAKQGAGAVVGAAPAKKTAAASSGFTCNNIDGTTVGTSIHSNVDDDGGGITQVVILKRGRCLSASMNGKVGFSPDERSITSLAPGSFASFRERLTNSDKTVSVTRGGGTIQYAATRDGNDVPFDAQMQSWLASFLPRVLREAGLNAPQRVARIKAQGGVSAVLAEIAEIGSSSAKHAHYDALLAMRLTDAEMEAVLRQAPRDLSSSGDLSSVIQKASKRGTVSKIPAGAVASALAGISSSGDKESTMAILAPTADRELLLTLAKAAEGISSSGDRANFLLTSAAYYLNPKDKELHEAYFRAAATLPSSGDLANVLISAAPYGISRPDIVTCILQALPNATSSGDRANVLITLATQHAIRTQSQRDAYTKAALALPPSDSNNALTALLQSGGE